MSLLFDQNLSHRLVESLSDVFPESLHVRNVGLDSAPDEDVWEYASRNDLILASKDSDMSDLALVNGFPPSIIWIRLGNCSTRRIEQLIRENVGRIRILGASDEGGILVLG